MTTKGIIARHSKAIIWRITDENGMTMTYEVNGQIFVNYHEAADEFRKIVNPKRYDKEMKKRNAKKGQ